MKKQNFCALVVGVVGCLVFGMGLCMCLIPEWNAFRPGVAVTAAGLLVMLVLALLRWQQAGRPMLRVDGRIAARVAVGVIGALTLGFGMCMVLVWQLFIPGIIVGIAGIVILLMLIPIIAGLK